MFHASSDRLSPHAETILSVLPYINPFSFDGDANSGDNVQLMCHVAKGDMPMKISWLFNGKEVQSMLGVVMQKLGDRSSFMTVPSVKAENMGSYTCLATNAAGIYNHTAQLFVNGRLLLLLVVDRNVCYFHFGKSLPKSLPFPSATRPRTRETAKLFSVWP